MDVYMFKRVLSSNKLFLIGSCCKLSFMYEERWLYSSNMRHLLTCSSKSEFDSSHTSNSRTFRGVVPQWCKRYTCQLHYDSMVSNISSKNIAVAIDCSTIITDPICSPPIWFWRWKLYYGYQQYTVVYGPVQGFVKHLTLHHKTNKLKSSNQNTLYIGYSILIGCSRIWVRVLWP